MAGASGARHTASIPAAKIAADYTFNGGEGNVELILFQEGTLYVTKVFI